MRHWVLIESGSNQDFIFQTNRQRFNVGASALVADMKVWVEQAIHEKAAQATAGQLGAAGSITKVVVTSSKALLLVGNEQIGRTLIEAVTGRAVRQAPGMDIWGVVGHGFDGGKNPMEGPLDEVHRLHADERQRRPSPKLRAPLTPFMDVCSLTGLPASHRRKRPGTEGGTDSEMESVSALAGIVLERAVAARAGWQSQFGDAVLTDLDNDISDAGWVAVVHVDGNGIGQLLGKFKDPQEYSKFSTSLERATLRAVQQAICKTSAAADEKHRENWILPLIIGGDDVTAVMDARRAVDFVRTYLKAFEDETSSAASMVDGAGHQHLTASAGIAFVKPHYPFHAAIQLAEELVRSAKEVKQEAPGYSSYDFHVLHDSVARPLAEIRKPITDAIRAPLVICDSPDTDYLEAHSDLDLIAAVSEWIDPDVDTPLSNKAMHELRTALVQPANRREAALDRVRLRLTTTQSAEAKKFIARWVPRGGKAGLLTICDLADVLTGTDRHFGEKVGADQATKTQNGAPTGTHGPASEADPVSTAVVVEQESER